MASKRNQTVKTFGQDKRNKDKKIYIDFVVRTIERKTGLTIQELKRTHRQQELYRIGLYYVTTTNKAICEALHIPVEAGTRRKRDLEKQGRLMASRKQRICPFTKDPARFLSTNPNKYNLLR